ncbi:MarR family winged helix-turn-helix transcriptional regulator [Carnobacterium mobile]|uniref:MarR family winged helix-turn-helix transcriptional regulator n=1 Tax=Carnobacterium mobile TaxID=2750 RepID=UPI000690CFD0|nr:MarR family transcriptional regulator [Carnobacterium mobile]
MHQNMELLYSVNQYTQTVMKKWTAAFPYPISISALLVLGELKTKGQQKQVTLAKFLKVTPGAMTNIANMIVQEKYAERVYDEKDRRITRLVITEQGKELVEAARTTEAKVNTDLLKVLSQKEKETFLELFRKINE